MRPGHDEWALRLAEVVAQRATCLRRSVGCVLTNDRHQVLATGYNGRAAGLTHCRSDFHFDIDGRPVNPNACSGATAPSGTNLDGCEAIHAEQNALLQCRDVWQIDNCYVTHSPCITCVKLLMNTGCKRIIFRERYAHDEPAMVLWSGREYAHDEPAMVLWSGREYRDGRQWICLP